MIRKVFFLVFFILAFYNVTYANDIDSDQIFSNDTTNVPKVYFFDNTIDEEEDFENSVFFFSYGNFKKERKGNIVAFFSNIEIDSKIDGNIYILFSNLKLNEKGSANNFNLFSSMITYSANAKLNVHSYLEKATMFIKENSYGDFKTYSDVIPKYILLLFWIFVKVFICFTLLAIRKGFFAQGSMIFVRQKSDMLKYGIISYFLAISSVIIFILSLVGIPVSIIFAIMYLMIIVLGQVSFGITIGQKIGGFVKIESIYLKLIIGITILESIIFIPMIGNIFLLAIFPIVFSGVFITTFINIYIKKIFYELPFDLYNYKTKSVNSKIKDIILSDVDSNNTN